MIVLKQKEYGWKDMLGKALQSAATIAKEELDKKYDVNTNDSEPIFGTLVIDWFIDRGRYIGKNKTYQVADDNSVEAFDKNSTIGWDLDEDFEPSSSCPSIRKKFTIEGIAKDGEYLKAMIIDKNGKRYDGKVIVEVRK